MERQRFFILFPVFAVFAAFGCGPMLKGGLKRPERSPVVHAAILSADYSPHRHHSGNDFSAANLPALLTSQLKETIKIHKRQVLALGGLLWLWLLFRFHAREWQRRRPRFSTEEIALIKTIKDNSTRIWENHRPGRNVVRLEEWRE